MHTHVKGGVRLLAAALAVVALGVGANAVAASAAGPRQDAIAQVRAATRQFHDVNNVIAAHYGLLTDLNGISCIDGPPGAGNMGYHYVNAKLVGNGIIDPTKPEAVLYEKTRSGLQITAVEYVVLAQNWHHKNPPELFGQQFMLQTAPNRFGLPDFWMLHAWIWKDNPSGRFNPWNPTVHCPQAG